jgi:hypothetical protein
MRQYIGALEHTLELLAVTIGDAASAYKLHIIFRGFFFLVLWASPNGAR